jgi:hypothetical protein
VLNGHTHRFRDTFAVSLLEAGVSLENVSTLLGHQSLRVTQKHYAPWVRTRQDALDRAVEAALTSIASPKAAPTAQKRRLRQSRRRALHARQAHSTDLSR